ncbi:MAG TPA: hypothetical protein VFY50_01490 [Candidatus Nitrosocosmicus sp.]|nr:hypothetical protein [Candidatus Nitrosocosmicus sp.]
MDLYIIFTDPMIIGTLRFTILQKLNLPLFSWLRMSAAAMTLVVILFTSTISGNFFLINHFDRVKELEIYRPHALINTAFADHGEEISIALNSGTFMPLTSAEGNQVRVGVNYTTLNGTLIGNTINAVMKVYAPNTTAIKSTSFPNGIIANNSGTAEIKTTIIGNSTQNVTAVVQFTDASKTVPLSNPVQIGLNLTQGAASMAVPIEPEYEIAAIPPE